jgi:hypothetical protein
MASRMLTLLPVQRSRCKGVRWSVPSTPGTDRFALSTTAATHTEFAHARRGMLPVSKPQCHICALSAQGTNAYFHGYCLSQSSLVSTCCE